MPSSQKSWLNISRVPSIPFAYENWELSWLLKGESQSLKVNKRCLAYTHIVWKSPKMSHMNFRIFGIFHQGVVSYGFWGHISMSFRLCMSEPYKTRGANQVVPYGPYGPPDVLIFMQKNSGKCNFFIFWAQKCPFLGPYYAKMAEICTQELWDYETSFILSVQDVLGYFGITSFQKNGPKVSPF